MNIKLLSTTPAASKLDALIITVPTFEPKSAPWKELGSDWAALCLDADVDQTFKGSEGSQLIFPTFGKVHTKWIALVGLGDRNEPVVHRKCIGKAARQLHKLKIKSLGVICLKQQVALEQIALAVESGTYRFPAYTPHPKDAPEALSELLIFKKGAFPKSVQTASALAEAIRYAKNLANQPPNYFTPKKLGEEAAQLAERRKLQCGILDEGDLKKEGFGALLAVGQGSQHDPRFIRLDYQGAKKNEAPYVLVGKAITFDTGGISIKPSDKMDEMKFDKCGGIAVLGIMDAIAAMKLPLNVTALIASAENMPSSTAYRPGDLVKSLSGKFIEIINTDAEGRVVLADALTYAARLKPKAIVDLATLTGACIICFGHESSAVLGNHQGLVDQLLSASVQTGERTWQMPLWPEYQEKVKSDIGFVKNSAGREGGTITAACFLNSFVDSKIPWAHLDIAGMAWTSSEEGHRAKGATAFGVQLVTHWLQNRKH